MPSTKKKSSKKSSKTSSKKSSKTSSKHDELLDDTYNFLYPVLDDPNFNEKIAKKKEFNDTRYILPVLDKEDSEKMKDHLTEDENELTIISEKLCSSKFELAPHQKFIKNFLSFQTPYNSLLLYHGLGSGKTCSAIGVSEEMREYMRRMNINKRIIIIASPNVQENFKLQLFDERKLEEVDGVWNMKSCTGNSFMNEINPLKMKGLKRESVIKNINKIIKTNYLFMGYIEFSNYIEKKTSVSDDIPEEEKKKWIERKIKDEFNGRMIVIDEVHNVRTGDGGKKISKEIMKLVESADNMRFVLLSATPMYNEPSEIIWLINLMNKNDKRGILEYKDIFNKDGGFKDDEARELLISKATGYVSFVRGENPFTFPFRIWPEDFEPGKTYGESIKPKIQMNGGINISNHTLKHISVYMNEVGDYQNEGYQKILEAMEDIPNFKDMESFGYNILQKPIQALNMVFPDPNMNEPDYDINELLGKTGLERIMKYESSYKPQYKANFEYINEKERIFSYEKIGDYSCKIKSILDNIKGSVGVVLVYSQYIDGGIVPMALALEELGFKRCGDTPSLLHKKHKTAPYNIEGDDGKNHHGQYSIISGDPQLSPNNITELKLLTNIDNKNGNKVKVVLISQAGAEGLDFKFIRQVHIMDPWYNMNRNEQIIGRAVRNCSHKDLELKDRNVMIFLHGTLLLNKEKQSADMYVYKYAEDKCVNIGLVSRALKEGAVDCLMNKEQYNFKDYKINMTLSSKHYLKDQRIENYSIKDKPFSSVCDYMEDCNYKCKPIDTIKDEDIHKKSYTKEFISRNIDGIISNIRTAMKKRFFYRRDMLIYEITKKIEYPLEEIHWALDKMVKDKLEFIEDQFGRIGNLINVNDLYIFKPIELSNSDSIEDFTMPIPYKHPYLREILKEKEAVIEDSRLELILKVMEYNYNVAMNEDQDEISKDELIMELDYKWYETFNESYNFIVGQYNIVNDDMNELLLIPHMFDELLIDDQLLLINHLLKTKRDKFTNKFYLYLEKIMIPTKKRSILLSRNNKPEFYIIHNNEIKKSTEEDDHDIEKEYGKINDKYVPHKTKLNKIIGFMFNASQHSVLKTKNITNKKDSGSRCLQKGKKRALVLYNDLVSHDKQMNDESKIGGKKITAAVVCQIQELTLRYLDIIEPKSYFFNSGLASKLELNITNKLNK